MEKYNLNEQLGLPENSSLQSLVDAWALTIPEEGIKDFLHEFDRERLLNRFENGERHISFRYWTRTATFEPMLAEDHISPSSFLASRKVLTSWQVSSSGHLA